MIAASFLRWKSMELRWSSSYSGIPAMEKSQTILSRSDAG
jgi:hypothetical protein